MERSTSIKVAHLSLRTRVLNMTLGILLLLVSLIPFLLFILPLFLLRLLHHLFAHLLRPDLEPLWKMEDAILSFAPTSAHINNNTAQVWRLHGYLDLDQFRTHFRNCFLSTPELCLKYRNLRCRIISWGCYTFRKNAERVDLNQLIQTGPNLDFALQLEPFIGSWMSKNDYPEDGPGWSALLLKGHGETILLLKMDHALTDGYTFAHLVSVLAGTNPPYLVQDFDLSIPKRLEIFLSFPKVAVDQLVSYWRAGSLPYPVTTTTIASDNNHAEQWLFSSTTMNLEKVKQIRRLSGVHFNTVLGSVVMGALRHHCTDTNNDKERKQLPKICYLPSPVGWPNHPAMVHGGMANHMSLRNQAFPFTETNPIARLHGGEKSLLEAEIVGQSLGFRWIFAPLGWCLPTSLLRFLLRAGNRLFRGGMTQVLTPLLLSPEPHHLLGLEVIGLHLPVHVPSLLVPTKVYVVPVSFSGLLELSVNGSSQAFKDQAHLDRFTKILLAEEVDLLYNAITTKVDI